MLAAILERKQKTKMSYDELAKKAHCPADSLRRLVSTKHTDEWSPEIRRAVCRSLGISTKTVISAEVELR